MNRTAVAKELVRLARSLVGKTYPEIVPGDTDNRRLWSEIEDVAIDICDFDREEDSSAAEALVSKRAREIARNYGPTTDIRTLAKTIEEYIWETYHNI